MTDNETTKTKDTNKATATLNYLELAACDLAATKAFFSAVFGWHFTDYGDEYAAFSAGVLEGGFYRAELKSLSANGGVLPVFYSDNLAKMQESIVAHGGEIIQPTFEFPGGFRFHFTEPSGNEFAVWSETNNQQLNQ